MKKIDLSGWWRFSIEDNKAFSDPHLKDAHWAKMSVPQNWFLSGLEHHGVVWFRHTFHYNATSADVLQTLRFEGVDYFADVYLNGHHLGQHSGYFEPFWFDVGEYIQEGVNILAVRVDSPFEEVGTNWHMQKQLIKGVLNHHDCRPGGGWGETGQSHNTGGIWNRVHLIEHNEISVDYKFLTANFDGEIPELNVDLVVNNRGEEEVGAAKILISPDNFPSEQRFLESFELKLSPGISTHSLKIPVADIKRWQPWERGYPHLYNVQLSLEIEGKPLIERETSFGFRTITVDEGLNWVVNDQPFYPRGSNYIASQWLSETLFSNLVSDPCHPFSYGKQEIDQNDDWFERDVSLMVAANLNTIRVHAHVLPSEFHAACDRAGLLVWQDFPFQWGYSDAPAFHQEAEKQIKAMLRLLYNHPSIAVWCVHNESPWDSEWMRDTHGNPPAQNQNRDLDEKLTAVLKRMDPTRYAHTNSGTGDGHTYPGWYSGTWQDYDKLPAVPLPTEFGAQAIPVKSNLLKMFSDFGPDAGYGEMIALISWIGENRERFSDGRMPTIDKIPEKYHLGYAITERWRFHNFQPKETFFLANIPMAPVLDRFIEESQAYQCFIIQYATETFRSNRDKTTGVFQFMMTDPWPAITWSVMDYWRTPKPGYEVLGRVMQPTLPVVSGILPELPTEGDNNWQLTVTNDRLQPFNSARCEWMFASGKGEEERGSIALDIPSFGISKPVPIPQVNIQEGENYLALFIYDENDDVIARNHYFFTGIS